MIEFANEGVIQHVSDIEAFAKLHDIYDSFDGRMRQLNDWGGSEWSQRSRFRVVLYKDFAPYSLGFSIHGGEAEAPLVVGGLIFHPGYLGKDTSLSVEIDSSNKPHWQLHT